MRVFDDFRWIAVGVLGSALLAGGCKPTSTPIGKPAVQPSHNAATKTDSVRSAPLKKTAQSAATNSTTSAKKEHSAKPFQPKPGEPRWDPKGIQEFQLVERSGKKISRADLLGKPFIAGFIFTSCRGPCKDITKEMFELQEWLKAQKMDVRLLTLSVDPKRDTPEVLARYAEVMGADGDRWWFVTGEQSEIFSLIRKSFLEVVYENQGADRLPGFEIAHTTGLMLVNEEGRVVGEYNAKYQKPLNALRRDLLEWKRTGKLPMQASVKKKDAEKKEAEKKKDDSKKAKKKPDETRPAAKPAKGVKP